jgi:hypothetical protein
VSQQIEAQKTHIGIINAVYRWSCSTRAHFKHISVEVQSSLRPACKHMKGTGTGSRYGGKVRLTRKIGGITLSMGESTTMVTYVQ